MIDFSQQRLMSDIVSIGVIVDIGYLKKLDFLRSRKLMKKEEWQKRELRDHQVNVNAT